MPPTVILELLPPVAVPYVAPPPLKKVKTDADNATSVPPPCCANAKELDVLIVTPAPAVTVDVPAPLLAMKIVSPTAKTELLIVTVFAVATFITMRLPTSPTSATYEAVWSLIGKVVMAFNCDARRVFPEPNGNGVAIMLLL